MIARTVAEVRSFEGTETVKAIRAHFDGKNVVVPPSLKGLPAGEVLVIFDDSSNGPDAAWLRVQETAFARVWDNDEDAAYDDL